MDKVLGAWGYLQARLAEPSTHASIAFLLGTVGYNLDDGVVHHALTAASVTFGMLGFFVKEGKPLS